MKRLARRMFTLCSAASLLLCVAVCALWVGSYERLDGFTLRTGGRQYQVGFPAGRLLVAAHARDGRPAALETFSVVPMDMDEIRRRSGVTTYQSFGGFGRYELRWGGVGVFAPCWFIAVVLAAPPAAWLAGRVRRRQRKAAGRCLACGYDLRASPGRCPECGTASAMQEGETPANATE